MFKNKLQVLRDVILIGIFIIAVGIVALVMALNREQGETALIKYENKLLFEVNMQTGNFTANTEVYKKEVEDSLIISEDFQFLYIEGIPFRNLEIGEGVLVIGNHYYIMGKLGIVHIEYNPTMKKIRVVDETSPYNICSKQGYSDNAPIVCLPNLIYITFSDSEVDFVIG